VKQAALELGLPVTDRLTDVTEAGAELGVVVAYGRIIPAAVLDVLPMVNVHFSLLPRWRGAAPVERAILAGDSGTGVSLMRLDEGLDTGPVLGSVPVEIGPGEHASSLLARLAEVGSVLLVDALAHGVGALGPGVAQEGEPTYAEKISTAELHLDWTRPAVELERVVRLDRAWTTLDGTRLLVLEGRARPGAAAGAGSPPGSVEGEAVRTGDGVLELIRVQPAGRRPMPGAEWRRGLRGAGAVRLGESGASEGDR
jgi:methionyl-tRNA formyltransferase